MGNTGMSTPYTPNVIRTFFKSLGMSGQRPERRSNPFFYAAIFWFAFSGAGRLPALDPSMPLADLVQRSWTAHTGLPQNTVNVLLQTRDGYLWIGTPSGLVRFDGVRIEVFNRSNTPGLGNDRILCLAEDGEGILWAGTDGGGLCAFRNGFWDRKRALPSLLDPHVRALVSDWKGALWAGTEYGLVRIDPSGNRRFTTQDGLLDNLITGLALGVDGTLWIGTMGGGLARYKDEVFRTYGFAEGLANLSVVALHADRAGDLWIGTLEGLFVLRQGREQIRTVAGTSYTPITAVFEDGQGTLWVGTMTDGLKFKSTGRLAPFCSKPGFPVDFIHAVLSDRSGRLWIGTETAGLIRFSRSHVHSITKKQGLPEQGTVCVIEDQSGQYWIGTRNSGVCVVGGNRVVRRITTRSGLSSNRIAALLESEDGRIWVGTKDRGIDVIRNEEVRHIGRAQGLGSERITVLANSGLGKAWIGTEQGLFRYDQGTIRIIDSADGLGRIPVRALLETRDGLIVGTESGIFRASGRRFKPLLDDVGNRLTDVRCLHEDRGGVLWMGTDGSGLWRWSEDTLTSWTVEDGLPDNSVFGIAEDDSGRIWMGSGRGIFRVSREDFDGQGDGKKPFLLPLWIDEEEGMPGRSCNNEGSPSMVMTHSRILLAATTSGLAVLDPDNLPHPYETPKSVVETVTAEGRIHCIGKEGPFVFKGRRLEFTFTAPCLDSSEKIRFRYRMEGVDPDWRFLKPLEGRIAVYENLSPKQYRFAVQGAGMGGIWESEGTVLEFTLSSSWASRPAFWGIVFVLLGAVSGIGLVIRKFLKTKHQPAKYQTSALIPERAEIVLSRLVELMEKERPYLDPDLTLPALSHRLKIHPNHLSQIIHERFGRSYNDFVNQYRIEEAKRRMADPGTKDKTVLEILYETGFYSKSVFNTAFKKVTGMTPSEFKKTLS
jgi:ligand-binding sensor domain-containing protein/AraC-like DNA-binding protein